MKHWKFIMMGLFVSLMAFGTYACTTSGDDDDDDDDGVATCKAACDIAFPNATTATDDCYDGCEATADDDDDDSAADDDDDDSVAEAALYEPLGALSYIMTGDYATLDGSLTLSFVRESAPEQNNSIGTFTRILKDSGGAETTMVGAYEQDNLGKLSLREDGTNVQVFWDQAFMAEDGRLIIGYPHWNAAGSGTAGVIQGNWTSTSSEGPVQGWDGLDGWMTHSVGVYVDATAQTVKSTHRDRVMENGSLSGSDTIDDGTNPYTDDNKLDAVQFSGVTYLFGDFVGKGMVLVTK